MNSGIIIYPTDTLYGIGCNPYDEIAVKKLIKLKKRSDKPLPVLCENIDQAEKLVHLGELGRKLAAKFWPGGLTIIAKSISKNAAKEISANTGCIGVRVPNHKCALKIISLCGGTLITTSANISGSKTLENPDEISQIFENKYDVLIYGGKKPSGIQSTVVDITNDTIKIIREGVISSNKLKKILEQGNN